jgi:hypothetical protein
VSRATARKTRPFRAVHFEYGVLHVATEEVHRHSMTVEEAVQWLAEWEEMGGKPDAFSIIRREIGAWEKP